MKLEIATSNELLVQRVLQEAISHGMEEICFCSGSRNTPFLQVIRNCELDIKVYFWPEERSAAFFALGRARRLNKPVGVIVTSGTAVGELLPATMEAYYTGVPLILLTADRPRRFRNTGAPQSAEQKQMFGVYTPFHCDLELDEPFALSSWDKRFPAQINVCLEEPVREWSNTSYPLFRQDYKQANEGEDFREEWNEVNRFLHGAKYPLVIVSTLKQDAREVVIQFLLKLNAPVFIEAISGLREEPRLQHLRIKRIDNLLKKAKEFGYPIDSVLRIGGVPTIRLWRDVEELDGKVPVLSVNEVPFSGISFGQIISVPLADFFADCKLDMTFNVSTVWLEDNKIYSQKLEQLCYEESTAEQSLVHHLSCRIKKHSHVYLGNSLPIREWDLVATSEDKQFDVFANRGVNGIDGQISTYLGLTKDEVSNFGIFGDLTAIYDLAGPWILSQFPEREVNIVIINNGGGKLFDRMYKDKAIQNLHNVQFEPFARLWNIPYERWSHVPENIQYSSKHRLIEIIPEDEATKRFNQKLGAL